MIDARDDASEFPVLHRARLGAFLNYGMMLARSGVTFGTAGDHLKLYQNAIEAINSTSSIPGGVDRQIFEFNGDIWHAFLLGELKLNRPNRPRSRKGGDPEGAFAEVEHAIKASGGIARVPDYNARRLLKIRSEALRCMGRTNDAESV